MRLLLISNSTGPDGGYLDHCADQMVEFIGAGSRVVFVPFAGMDEEAYGTSAVERLNRMGLSASWADRSRDPLVGLVDADAVFVGGGNTFVLLDRLIATGMLDAISERVHGGMTYVGASAGSNVAGPTIKTTNDMPIVEPPTFASFGFIPFQLNPHYIDRDPDSNHQGETREQRLTEYLACNDVPVVALREGAILVVDDGSMTLSGRAGARLYRRGGEVEEIGVGTNLDGLPGYTK